MSVLRALLISVLMATSAHAADRGLADWFMALCAGTAPSFADLEARVDAIGGKPTQWDYNPSTHAQIEVAQYRVWSVPGPKVGAAGLRVMRAAGTVADRPARSCWMALEFPPGTSKEKAFEALELASAAVLERRLKAELSLGPPDAEGETAFYAWRKTWNLPMKGASAAVSLVQGLGGPAMAEQIFGTPTLVIIDNPSSRGDL